MGDRKRAAVADPIPLAQALEALANFGGTAPSRAALAFNTGGGKDLHAAREAVQRLLSAGYAQEGTTEEIEGTLKQRWITMTRAGWIAFLRLRPDADLPPNVEV